LLILPLIWILFMFIKFNQIILTCFAIYLFIIVINRNLILASFLFIINCSILVESCGLFVIWCWLIFSLSIITTYIGLNLSTSLVKALWQILILILFTLQLLRLFSCRLKSWNDWFFLIAFLFNDAHKSITFLSNHCTCREVKCITSI